MEYYVTLSEVCLEKYTFIQKNMTTQQVYYIVLKKQTIVLAFPPKCVYAKYNEDFFPILIEIFLKCIQKLTVYIFFLHVSVASDIC